MSIAVEVGLNIRKARKAKGLKSYQLAAIVGIKACNLSRIENGHANITLHTMCKISDALDAVPMQLVATQETPLKKYEVCVTAEVSQWITVSALDEDSATELAHERFVLHEAFTEDQSTHMIKEITND